MVWWAKRDPKLVNAIGSAGTIGLHLASGPIAGLVMGWLVDDYFGVAPWGVMVGLVLGIVAGFKMVFEDLRKLEREQAREASGAAEAAGTGEETGGEVADGRRLPGAELPESAAAKLDLGPVRKLPPRDPDSPWAGRRLPELDEEALAKARELLGEDAKGEHKEGGDA